ncbi:MAG TPA: hypothetical protein VMB27_16950 [Solirubrobacteraceae bacterium]|nr:hypothetical protein [Solirubrobacteraceae bacterium]
MRLVKRVGPAVATGLAIAACGGGTSTSTTSKGPGNVNEQPSKAANGQMTFSAPGMAIHFQYPAQFHAVALAPSRRIAGSTSRATHSAIAIGDYDLLIVSRYPGLKYPVTSANIGAVKPQFDAVLSKVLGRKIRGTVGAAGGLPAIFWPREPVVGLPVKASVMIVNVFLGKDEYELQCQATPAHLATVEAACQEMLATLTTRRS